MPHAEATDTDRNDQLAWVAGVLVGDGAGRADAVLSAKVPAGRRSVMRFLALPGPAHPYVLAPDDSSSAVAEAVRGLGNPSGKGKRLIEAGLAAGVPAVHRLLRPESLHLSVPESSAHAVEPTLEEHLRDALHIPDLRAVVILGRSRPNRKPVLRLVSNGGRTIAFAKVGWNDVTRLLVRNEASVLTTLGDPRLRPRSFHVPRVILAETWRELELLVVSAAPPEHWLHDGPPLSLPLEPTREVMANGGLSEAPLRETPYWKRVKERAERIADQGSETSPVTAAIAGLDRDFGDRAVPVGRWHGDWTPWNMSKVDGRLFVWDWERSEAGVPAGMDVAHFDFDVRAKIRGQTPETAARESLRRGGRLLARVGLRADLAPLLWRMHLVEMCLRFSEGQAAGVEAEDPVYLDALRELSIGAPGA